MNNPLRKIEIKITQCMYEIARLAQDAYYLSIWAVVMFVLIPLAAFTEACQKLAWVGKALLGVVVNTWRGRK